jgi:hypothetical protein
MIVGIKLDENFYIPSPRLCVELDSITASARADLLRPMSLGRASTKTDIDGDEKKRLGPECKRPAFCSCAPRTHRSFSRPFPFDEIDHTMRACHTAQQA